jgi:hypothetical protein
MRTKAPLYFALLTACSGTTQPSIVSTPLYGGDAGVAIGSGCTNVQERDPAFSGFDLREVSVESLAGHPSGAPVCLAYHFQGRVSCPYGQAGSGPAQGAAPCTTPDGQPVTVRVAPQCLDRRAANVVVWSCRCANAMGGTEDGANYCSCPSGTTCAQAGVASIGTSQGSDDLSGAYCLPLGAESNPSATCAAQCDPALHSCD